MSSHNYYTNAYSDPPQTSYANAYHDHDRRTDAPLPPLPYDPSPPPFADPYRQPSSTAQSSRYDSDPYEDRDAIPLGERERERKHGSMHSVAPILPPQHPDDDAFVRDAKPGKRRRRGEEREEDEGWFRGKITWVCFFMSSVQLIVFLAEVIKYGECCLGMGWILLEMRGFGADDFSQQACSRERRSRSSLLLTL